VAKGHILVIDEISNLSWDTIGRQVEVNARELLLVSVEVMIDGDGIESN